MEFADSFDIEFIIRRDMEKMMKNNVLILMFTGSLSLFDVITNASNTVEKRLMIDLAVVNTAFNKTRWYKSDSLDQSKTYQTTQRKKMVTNP